MNLERCESFGREAQALLGQVDQLMANLDQVNANLRIVSKTGNLEQAKRLNDQKQEINRLIEVVSGVLFDRTNKSSVDSARTLIVDLFARVELAQREFTNWRAQVADFEFRAGEGDPEFDRQAEERRIDALKKRYERRVALAAEQIPEKPVVLLP